jgi:hypothetical protein
MVGLGTGAGAPVVKVYHEKSMILPDVSRVLACLYEKNVEFETVKDSYKDILRLQVLAVLVFVEHPDCSSGFLSLCELILYKLLYSLSASAVHEECSSSIL